MRRNNIPSFSFNNVSNILTSTWFGSSDENNHIMDGRWAHTNITKLSDDRYARSYWNNNPDPEITRHSVDICGVATVGPILPSCSAHYQILTSQTLGELQLLTSASVSPSQLQLGGVYGGCTDAYTQFYAKWGDLLNEKITVDMVLSIGFNVSEFGNVWGYEPGQRKDMISKYILNEYDNIYKSLWRSHTCSVSKSPGLLECPKECMLLKHCTCTVPKLSSGEITIDEILPCIFPGSSYRHASSFLPRGMIEDLVAIITGSSMFEGDLVSSSVSDPLFWIMNPTIQRLVTAKRVTSTNNKMGALPFDPLIVSDKDQWLDSQYNFGSNESKFDEEDNRCVGHAADDPALPEDISLPYTDAVERVADVDGDGIISNWEILSALDPMDIDGNDYVFENFEWSHC